MQSQKEKKRKNIEEEGTEELLNNSRQFQLGTNGMNAFSIVSPLELEELPLPRDTGEVRLTQTPAYNGGYTQSRDHDSGASYGQWALQWTTPWHPSSASESLSLKPIPKRKMEHTSRTQSWKTADASVSASAGPSTQAAEERTHQDDSDSPPPGASSVKRVKPNESENEAKKRTSKVPFTEEEDEKLAAWIARKLPAKETSGRMGQKLYQDLCDQDGEPGYAWVATHSWQSWRERYKNNAPRLDRRISAIAAQKPTQDALVRQNTGGGHPGQVRTPFTEEDEQNLVDWIAQRIPMKEQGGRTGIKLYQQLEARSGQSGYEWVTRHTWQSWRERYKKNASRLDPLIDIAVKKKATHGHDEGRRKKKATQRDDEGLSAQNTTQTPVDGGGLSQTDHDVAGHARPLLNSYTSSHSSSKPLQATSMSGPASRPSSPLSELEDSEEPESDEDRRIKTLTFWTVKEENQLLQLTGSRPKGVRLSDWLVAHPSRAATACATRLTFLKQEYKKRVTSGTLETWIHRQQMSLLYPQLEATHRDLIAGAREMAKMIAEDVTYVLFDHDPPTTTYADDLAAVLYAWDPYNTEDTQNS